MNDERFVQKYVNGLGENRYQPRLPDGRGCYTFSDIHEWYLGKVFVRPACNTRYEAKLYRSKSRAIRVAKREYKRRERSNFVQEV